MAGASRWSALYVLVAVVVAVGAALLFDSDDESPAPAAGGLSPIPLGQQDIADFDPPPGDGKENSENLDLALDGKSTTAWETENYDTPDLGGIKDGVGVYLDTGRPVVARGLRITTPKSGWKFGLYTADAGPPAALSGWEPAGGGEMTRMREAFRLNTRGQAKRYYLVWITGLTEGSHGRSNAAISELELARANTSKPRRARGAPAPGRAAGRAARRSQARTRRTALRTRSSR